MPLSGPRGSLSSVFIPAGRLGTAPQERCFKLRSSNPFYSPPFPLALDDPGSVLAVKGSLRRFAPWTAPGRSEEMGVYEGKGGCRSASDFVSHLISLDSIAPRPKPGHSGRACRAEGNLSAIPAAWAVVEGAESPAGPQRSAGGAQRLDPPLGGGYFPGVFVLVDLFTGVVVPTTCSLTTCLITCMCYP